MILRCFTRLISVKRFTHHSTLYTWTRISPTTFITTSDTSSGGNVPPTPNPSTLIAIDSTAATRLSSLRSKFPNKFLRVLVDGGGCHGYQYVYKLDDKFDEREDIGLVGESSELGSECSTSYKNEVAQDTLLNPPVNAMPVVVDRVSLDLLLNSRLVYQQDMMGEQFAIIDNPIADTGCGCGVSFGIKESVKG